MHGLFHGPNRWAAHGPQNPLKRPDGYIVVGAGSRCRISTRAIPQLEALEKVLARKTAHFPKIRFLKVIERQPRASSVVPARRPPSEVCRRRRASFPGPASA